MDLSDNLPSTSNAEIDKWTLELLINKTQYNKYLSKTDPSKYQKHQEHLMKIELYLEKIMELTHDLLENPEKQITTDINTSFEQYIKTCIHYFEMKEYEEKCSQSENQSEDNDDDMMFGKIDDSSTPTKGSSFWGKSIYKKNHMDMFFPKK
jgi:hypothetical protein